MPRGVSEFEAVETSPILLHLSMLLVVEAGSAVSHAATNKNAKYTHKRTPQNAMSPSFVSKIVTKYTHNVFTGIQIQMSHTSHRSFSS